LRTLVRISMNECGRLKSHTVSFPAISSSAASMTAAIVMSVVSTDLGTI